MAGPGTAEGSPAPFPAAEFLRTQVAASFPPTADTVSWGLVPAGPLGPWDLVDISEGISDALPLSSPLLSVQCSRGSYSLSALTSQVSEHVVVVQLQGLSTVTLLSRGFVSVFCSLEEGHCVVLPSLQHSRNNVFQSAQSSDSLVMTIAVLKTGTVRKAIAGLSPL